tara:strand:- start:755 stop:1600 length:846 start_codon:yes stop_codon:yes gene_type:complete
MKLKVKKFNPQNLKPHRISLIVGKRGSGKSKCLVDLLYNMPKVDFVIGMAPTEETIETFRQFIPESCIYHQFNQNKLEQMIALQREMVRKKIDRSFLLILDDCLYEKSVLKSTAMRELFLNGRHLHISMIICAQYVMDLSPDLRTNVDYIFAMRENIIANRAKLHKFFYGMFEKYEDFAKTMDATTANFGSMVLDNTSKSNEIEDCIYWYRARIDFPPFRLGKDIFWKLDKKCKRIVQESNETIEEITQMRNNDDKNSKRITAVHTTDESGAIVKNNSVVF